MMINWRRSLGWVSHIDGSLKAIEMFYFVVSSLSSGWRTHRPHVPGWLAIDVAVGGEPTSPNYGACFQEIKLSLHILTFLRLI